jgi:hypothetical protein
VDELAAALDALAAQDLHAMFPAQLDERLGELICQANRLAAELTRTARECDTTGAAEHDGLTTTASWLRGHARYSGPAAAQLVAAGRALDHLPAVAAAYAAGALTPAQVTVIAAAVGPDQLTRAADQGIDLTAIDPP